MQPYFHTTLYANIPQIAVEGLRLRVGDGLFQHGGYAAHSQGRIFASEGQGALEWFGKVEDQAQHYYVDDDEPDRQVPVMLRLRLDGIKIREDTIGSADVDGSVFVEEAISPERIEYWSPKGDTWVPIDEFDATEPEDDVYRGVSEVEHYDKEGNVVEEDAGWTLRGFTILGPYDDGGFKPDHEDETAWELEWNSTTESLKRVRDRLYVHRTAIGELPTAAQRNAVPAAQRVVPCAKTWDVVRVAADGSEVMFGRTTNFERKAHPELLESVVVRKHASGWREHRRTQYDDPPVYHRKEQMLPAHHPRHSEYAALSEAEEAAGLLGRPDIGRRSSWARALVDAGYAVRGHKLVHEGQPTPTPALERLSRKREPSVPSLTKAQWKALEDFAQPGGHGYGDDAYLARSTAGALERRDLVELFSKRVAGERWAVPMGRATIFGIRALAAKRADGRRTAYEDEALALLKYRSEAALARYEAQAAASGSTPAVVERCPYVPGADPRAWLAKDHAEIRELGSQVLSSLGGDLRQAARCMTALQLELEQHFSGEEDAVFPLWIQSHPEQNAALALRELALEHPGLLEEARQVDGALTEVFGLEQLTRFLKRLEAHAEREEALFGIAGTSTPVRTSTPAGTSTLERLAVVPADVVGTDAQRSGRTAITRGGPSSVVRWLYDRGHLRGPILDYGSGMGEDATWLRDQGFQVRAYDPVHGPRDLPPKARYNTVLATFVLNTLPRKYEVGILTDLLRLLKPGGVAYVAVRSDAKGGKRGRGGSTTYQRDVRLPLPEAGGTPSGVRIYYTQAKS